MTSEERRRELENLQSQSGELIAKFFAETPEPEGSIVQVLERSRAEAAERMVPKLFEGVSDDERAVIWDEGVAAVYGDFYDVEKYPLEGFDRVHYLKNPYRVVGTTDNA